MSGATMQYERSVIKQVPAVDDIRERVKELVDLARCFEPPDRGADEANTTSADHLRLCCRSCRGRFYHKLGQADMQYRRLYVA